MENIISIIAIFLSAVSLCISIRTFFYDRTIKKDAVKKIKEEEIEKKKANLYGSYNQNGTFGIIQISNKGNVMAQNLIISIGKDFTLKDENSLAKPFDLSSESNFRFEIYLSENSPKTINVGLKWDDEYMNDNEKTIELSCIKI